MKTQKLNFHDFEAVENEELLRIKGGIDTMMRVDQEVNGGCCCGADYGSGIANSFASWFGNNFGWATPAVEWHERTTGLATQWVNENVNGQAVLENVVGAIFGSTAGALIQGQTLNQGATPPLNYQERDSIQSAVQMFGQQNGCK
ncbi:MAG: hypothetical protein AAF600_02670 [Bacteroidota bacterium]